MCIMQERILIENGKAVTDQNGIIKHSEETNLTKEEWLELLDKADKITNRAYALMIDYGNYQYSLRIGNNRLTENTDYKAWINKNWSDD